MTRRQSERKHKSDACIPWVGDEPKVRFGGFTNEGRDQTELLDVIATRVKRFAAEHLSEGAPDAPDVDGLVVALDGEQDLRRAIPSGNHVPSKLGSNKVDYGNAHLLQLS